MSYICWVSHIEIFKPRKKFILFNLATIHTFSCSRPASFTCDISWNSAHVLYEVPYYNWSDPAVTVHWACWAQCQAWGTSCMPVMSICPEQFDVRSRRMVQRDQLMLWLLVACRSTRSSLIVLTLARLTNIATPVKNCPWALGHLVYFALHLQSWTLTKNF